MTEYSYNQTIKYLDGTLDKNFNDAQKWALTHNTTFTEDLSKRDLPKRYFVIGGEHIPTEDEKKQQVRAVRSEYYDKYVDWYQSKPLLWAELTEEEKTDIANYRLYLKDYTNKEAWWYNNPMTFEEWINVK